MQPALEATIYPSRCSTTIFDTLLTRVLKHEKIQLWHSQLFSMKAERAICSNAHMDHSDCFEINLLERYPLLFSSYILSFILNMKIVFYESANSTVFSWFFLESLIGWLYFQPNNFKLPYRTPTRNTNICTLLTVVQCIARK